nr:coat protein [Carrot chordovirus 3]
MSYRQRIMNKRRGIVMTALLEELKSLNTGIEIGDVVDNLDAVGLGLLNNYRDHFLINMAEIGTSPDTCYESESFDLPRLTISVNGEKKDFRLKMNLLYIINAIKSKIEDNPVMAINCTLRNCLSPFGVETCKQLKLRRVDGLLARKYPKICRQAMHMGFDFNQDIPSSELSRTELKVKQYLYQQLKRSEARKTNIEDDVGVIDFE